MTRGVRAGCALLGLLIVAVLGAAAARGDDFEEVVIDDRAGLGMEQRVRARVLPTRAGRRIGGYGYVRVELINPTRKAHDIRMRITPAAGGDTCYFRRTRRLEPSSRVTLDLPLMNSRGGMTLWFESDGRGAPGPVHLGSGRSRRSLSVLHVFSQRPQEFGPLLVEEMKRQGGMKRPVEIVERTARLLPGSWRLLSGFDLVIADAADIGAEAQQTLLRYAAGGGSLIVTRRGGGADGPLKALPKSREVTGVQPWRGHYGLGRWILLPDDEPDSEDALRAWLRLGSLERVSILSPATRVQAGALPYSMWLPLQIPGLGRVPTGVFFVLILIFAVLVGPVSYIYLRRRRRLPLLLLTMPLAGFLCTAAILGYGIFKEGFGIVGSRRTFSVLDQRSQVAASHGSQTLYAGLQPSALDPGADSSVFCASFTPDQEYDARPSYLQVDLDAGQRIDGSVLPSRTPTAFVTTTVGRARDRLRFRRREDGGYDVLASPDFAPTPSENAVLFRSPQGEFYASGATGQLVAVNSQGPSARQAIVDAVSDMPLGQGEVVSGGEWRVRSRFHTEGSLRRLGMGSVSLSAWLRLRLPSLLPGSYLARMRRPPLLDELGLDVDFRAEEHVVFGILGPEDVLDE